MVTASHNENDWTGLKLANGLSSTLMSSEIQAFREIVYGEDFESGAGTYSQRHDICEQYLGDLKKRVRLSTASRVVIGTGNGTAGHFAPRILRMSGCEVIEHHCELNWDFPNYNPNPEDLDFLRSIGDRVRDSKAELGLAIDGDGDRLGVVNEHGKEVFSDKVGLLLSRWLASRSPGCTIVIDVKSTGLYYSDPVLKEHGVRIEMVPTGHSYVKDAVRRHNAVAGFERSGHWFFNEPFGYGYDDANLAALYVLAFIEQTGSTLADMALGLRRTWQTPTMSIDCPDDEKYGVVESVTAAYSEIAQAGHGIAGIPIADITTVNGVRFTLEDGSWDLIRASSNKPSLVVVAESFTSEDQLYEISRQIKQTLATAGIIGSYDQELPDKKQQCGGEVRDGQRRIR